MAFTLKSSRKSIIALAISIVATGLFSFLLYSFSSRSLFLAYDASRDRADILNLYENERYWLTDTPGYSAEHMLDTKSPSESRPSFKGKLQIYTVRNKGVFVGFCAYYFKRKDLGQILYIAVQPEFRNQGYARKMVQFCLDKIKQAGAQHAMILTRTNNFPAQRSYESVGFVESIRDEGFVYYFYDFNQTH